MLPICAQELLDVTVRPNVKCSFVRMRNFLIQAHRLESHGKQLEKDGQSIREEANKLSKEISALQQEIDGA